MPRDASGNYTLPLGNPVIDGTIIDVNWANPTMADIAAQLNNVYTRDGLLGPAAPFKIIDGTMIAPGLAWNTEPGLGWYRPSASIIASAAQGGTTSRLDAQTGAFTGYTLFPRSAGGSAQFGLVNQPEGLADYNYLIFVQQANGSGLITTGAAGAAVRGDLIIDAPNVIMPGNLNVTGGTGVINAANVTAKVFQVNDVAGTNRNVQFLTAGVMRWQIRTNGGAESGGNVGSDFDILRFDDAGNFLAEVLNFNRSNGNAVMSGALTVGGITNNGTQFVAGDLSTNGNLWVAGTLTVINNATFGNPVQFNSDTNTLGTARFQAGWVSGQGAINNAGNTDRNLFWQSSGSARWNIFAQGIAEGAGNTGNDLLFGRYDNAGAWLGAALRLDRSNGNATFEGAIATGATIFAGATISTNSGFLANAGYFQASAASGGAYRFNGGGGGVGLYSFNWTDLSPTYRDIVLIDASSIQQVSRIHSQYNTGTGINQFTYFVGPVTYTMESSGIAVAQGSWADASDIRFKANLAPISNAMAKLRKLSGYTYDRTDLDNVRSAGVVAQEVFEVLPEAVTSFHHEGHDADRYAVAGNAVMALLINAIKETDVRLAHLESRTQGA